ncbi:ADP-ribosylation [Stereum hirsutum FP-91666 SS1]|uniref:ADP-ribosylation n=1 Tax=Stereum hirsutum (strain FP-91666) TaxID=721885 RepID=UPI000444A376|nr:ADP-ribosylation [Stereum hirsutum FP-91666 SS1]EIM85393.1 ADP-ribosylation [Stereum hirsutum FP-91666 SS1]
MPSFPKALPFNCTTSLFSSPELVSVERVDTRFFYIEELFLSGWKHSNKERMRVTKIFEVKYDKEGMQSYEKYRDRKAFHTESFQFHGTPKGCPLGQEDSYAQPCLSSSCALCSILRGSFEVERSGARHNFQRFGKGIYLTSISSKADDYVDDASGLAELQASNSKAMILARVVLGRPRILTRTDQRLKAAPRGYDSVTGQPGGDLNYEETVVYDNDAVRPAFVVMYEPDFPDPVDLDGDEALEELFSELGLDDSDDDTLEDTTGSLSGVSGDISAILMGLGLISSDGESRGKLWLD